MQSIDDRIGIDININDDRYPHLALDQLHTIIRERTIIGSELDRGRFKWIGSDWYRPLRNDADRRCDKIHECGDKYG